MVDAGRHSQSRLQVRLLGALMIWSTQLHTGHGAVPQPLFLWQHWIIYFRPAASAATCVGVWLLQELAHSLQVPNVARAQCRCLQVSLRATGFYDLMSAATTHAVHFHLHLLFKLGGSASCSKGLWACSCGVQAATALCSWLGCSAAAAGPVYRATWLLMAAAGQQVGQWFDLQLSMDAHSAQYLPTRVTAALHVYPDVVKVACIPSCSVRKNSML
jgi:hypothetical protein